MTCLSKKTHKAFLNAIILRSLHTMALDLFLLCDGLDTLIAEKEIEQISKR
jgi:hypothetical protein